LTSHGDSDIVEEVVINEIKIVGKDFLATLGGRKPHALEIEGSNKRAYIHEITSEYVHLRLDNLVLTYNSVFIMTEKENPEKESQFLRFKNVPKFKSNNF